MSARQRRARSVYSASAILLFAGSTPSRYRRNAFDSRRVRNSSTRILLTLISRGRNEPLDPTHHLLLKKRSDQILESRINAVEIGEDGIGEKKQELYILISVSFFEPE